MKAILGNLRIQQCMVFLGAMLVSMQAWAGPAGPGGDTSSAAPASSSLMARGHGGAPQVPRDQDAQPEVFGKTYGEWAAKWVKWAEAGPSGQNAIEDTTGEFCDANQPKRDVWFLAGTFVKVGVERSCTIPKDRALFYPLIEQAWIDCPDSPDEDLSDAEVRAILAELVDLSCQLTSTVDGVAISSLQVLTARTQSPTFRSVLPDNPVGAGACDPPLVGGKTGRRLVDGYWVMLPPLSPGEHTLTLHGATCVFPDPEDKSATPDPQRGRVVFEVGVTYHLTVLGKHCAVSSFTVTPSVLWPPNHKMVPVSIVATAADACDAAPVCRIVKIASNEPVNGLGDGDTAPDWEITGALTANLRAERSGTGVGRTYTLGVQCMDASGNAANQDVLVTVPKSMR